jgi:hypothetical protein
MHRIFVFGEAEKGRFCTPHFIYQLPKLLQTFGHAPKESLGIYYAIQALLFERELIFFRIDEEGFSIADYRCGIDLLSREGKSLQPTAICLPGVGDRQILDPLQPIAKKLRSLLVVSEADLFDYLTSE